MAFDANGFRKAAMQAGIPRDQIDQAVAQRTGVKGWLSGGKQGISGAFTSAGNILNLPSYAIGGMLNQGQRAFGSKYGQKTDATGLGILEGIKNKRAVFTEAPETFGVDPNSKLGMGIGFGAELLTPDIPIAGLINDLYKGSKVASKFRNIGKLGNVTDDMARVLLEKSYKLSASDIQKIAESIGVTDESQKAIKVIDYLEGLGLRGSNRGSLKTLNKVTDNAQNAFDKVTRTGGQISRIPFIDELYKLADEAEKADTPASRNLYRKIVDEIKIQESKMSEPLTDTELTNRISKLWKEAGDSAISDPSSSNLSKSIAKAGQSARETLRPGSTAIGRELKGYRTAQEVVGKKANTGLGTQLINAFKPSGAGFGVGAVAGYSSGQDPLKSGILGAVGGVALNNPRVMNSMGKFLQKGVNLPKVPTVTNKYLKAGINTAKKVPLTGFRVGAGSTGRESLQSDTPQQITKQQLNQSYTPSIPQPVKKPVLTKEIVYKQPKNVFSNKSSFGKNFKLKARN